MLDTLPGPEYTRFDNEETRLAGCILLVTKLIATKILQVRHTFTNDIFKYSKNRIEIEMGL